MPISQLQESLYLILHTNEARLKKIDEREKKIQSIQENLERFVETKSEQIKKQEEKRQQNAEKNLPAVSW